MTKGRGSSSKATKAAKSAVPLTDVHVKPVRKQFMDSELCLSGPMLPTQNLRTLKPKGLLRPPARQSAAAPGARTPEHSPVGALSSHARVPWIVAMPGWSRFLRRTVTPGERW